MRKFLLATAMLTVLGGSPAFASDTCLRVGQIYNWNAMNDKTLIVEDNWHKKFKLRLLGICNDLRFHEAVAFRSIGGSDLSCLDRGDQVIIHDHAMGREACSITKIEPYTPEMAKADKDAAEAAKVQHSSY